MNRALVSFVATPLSCSLNSDAASIIHSWALGATLTSPRRYFRADVIESYTEFVTHFH